MDISMIKALSSSPIADEKVRALLVRNGCPVKFHEVRTRFMGNSLSMSVTYSGRIGGCARSFGSCDD